ncbi:hypothetical protein [Pseudonocardia acidicola]|uniref:DUF2399 domain-containing protein n=1 Tax=Pseudonocardia acidicola TaxID=2724939 RepID=A0ABX1SJX8_9PSEU|nr:hypothetical protein [Pseudonocardia acidicola]NMI01872.1 hypothetical protein [Pseudonocardia acidicola]
MGLLTAAESREVLRRYGTGELDVDQAAVTLADTVAAHRARAELCGDYDGPGPDFWHALADARWQWTITTEHHDALVRALRAGW